ncbi:hypothetical protein B5E77_05030 [Lachnoclostridium sp. An131]|uniref:hypothetical protein n=1 Tax=Lachnoclostridium sp. An131 TaxID=1965555 RepID=UPI000B389287|nr:hypothetical protein [Lachnoclostridium sp. An131]OUQ27723.1 hypothetical protein B5E77_05030 [Lachnoclostridium sp. An131]
MFCVIQEVAVRKASKGEPRTIEVHETRLTLNGEEYIFYGYNYSSERFERPVKNSFRISIHQSYREAGKVRKKQTVICTVRYYDIVDLGGWIGDCCSLNDKAVALGISENELVDMVYKKFQPIIDRVMEEYSNTEEYVAREKHRRVIDEYRKQKEAFAEEYGVSRDVYDRCFDVFGKLRNPEYLQKIQTRRKEQAEYERQSRENSRRYWENNSDNYGGYDNEVFGGYTTDDKAILKKFYRTLSKAFHPDSNPDKDTSEEMKVLNSLKSKWGL